MLNATAPTLFLPCKLRRSQYHRLQRSARADMDAQRRNADKLAEVLIDWRCLVNTTLYAGVVLGCPGT